MFQRLGITDTHRVSARNVNQTKELWQRGDRLILHPNITLEDRDGRPSNFKHVENIYEYPEVACLLSHLKAILRAYEDGHEQALILEDDAMLSYNFLKQWHPYVQRAPSDWKILQFATNNKNVVKQGVNLLDFFITWQPYHWSTRAYIINREGMEIIVNKTHSYSETGSDIWRVDNDPMVVADEVLYYIVGEAYTSTRLWVDASGFGSTIQSKNAHSNLTDLVGAASNDNMLTSMLLRTTTTTSAGKQKLPQSVLVLMSMRLRTVQDVIREVHWIQQDNEIIAAAHDTCEWEVNVALTDNHLLDIFQKEISTMPRNVHFHITVSDAPFNKFSYLRDFVEEMNEYDFVLFKDNDQRIAGFPWRTFVDRKGDAVMAGPLRQSADEALLYRHAYPKRQWFQFHAAEAWTEDWNTQWSSRLYAEIVPTEVPMLEMYFVLMDGKFANWFFDLILTPSFVNQTSAWGPDLLWCPAAREWSPDRPSCHLVPLASAHEDTRQIVKNTTAHKEGGFNMVGKFKENPKFEDWMHAPQAWKDLIGGNLLWQIERKCRQVLRLRMKLPFDLQRCARKMYHMHDAAKAAAANKAAAEANAEQKQGGTTTTSANKAGPRQGVYTSTGPGRPPIDYTSMGRKTTPYKGVHNRTRVAELVQSVKSSWNASRLVQGAVAHEKSSESRPQQTLESFQARLAKLKLARQQRQQQQQLQQQQPQATSAGHVTVHNIGY